MTDKEVMLWQVAQYIKPGAIVPVDMQTTQLLVNALRAALAQPEPDYEAEFIKDWNEGKVKRVSDGKRMVPEREWQGLTDEEISDIWGESLDVMYSGHYSAIRSIEQALKEKNNG